VTDDRLRLGVLRVGDRVASDGAEQQVVALSGNAVRLHSPSGPDQVVLLPHLLASPGGAAGGRWWRPGAEPVGAGAAGRPARRGGGGRAGLGASRGRGGDRRAAGRAARNDATAPSGVWSSGSRPRRQS